MTEEQIDTLSTTVAALQGEVIALSSALAQLQQKLDDSTSGTQWNWGLPIYGDGAWQGAFKLTTDDNGTQNFTNCVFALGRQIYHLNDQPCSGAGTWVLEINHETPNSSTVKSGSESPEQTDLKTTIPLLKMKDGGEIEKDWRGMPMVAIWE